MSPLERAARQALRELDVASRVEAALPRSSRVPVSVIALGKAAPAMAAGAIARLGGAIDRCVVVAPDGTPATDTMAAARRAGIGERLTVLRASHPLPDARSVRAGEVCLATARECRGLLVVLVSGGASALACAPTKGITLRRKQAVTRAMLESGASVQEINVVRKHLSRLKGGGLARTAASSSSVLTIVVSDVIGGAAGDVGSGPSVADASTVSDARRLLLRFAPSFASVPLASTLSPGASAAKRLRSKIVLGPEDFPRAVGRLLERTGISVRVLPPSQAPVERLAADYVALARRTMNEGRSACVFVRAAEPSVVVEGRGGKGGRCAHVAALVGRALADVATSHARSARLVRFAALASDGVDGASETGGAVVDARFAARVAARLGPDALDRSIASFDTGTLHRLMRMAVLSAPTGQNLADLHILVVG